MRLGSSSTDLLGYAKNGWSLGQIVPVRLCRNRLICLVCQEKVAMPPRRAIETGSPKQVHYDRAEWVIRRKRESFRHPIGYGQQSENCEDQKK
jgi:hypothetical protein